MKIRRNNKSNKNYERSLEEDKTYIVYAFSYFKDYLRYAIVQNDLSFFPVWYPSELFDIVDNRLSRYWVFKIRDICEVLDKEVPICAFPEWADDIYFYTNLIEGNWDDPNSIIFKKYKKLMDLEFPDPSIIAKAEIGDENWLICPGCIDAWESKESRDALVKCPKCQVIYNNPRYTNEWPHP